MQGVDEGYSDSVGYGFGATAKGYGSAREVWKPSRPKTWS